jgi:hypothetical protein
MDTQESSLLEQLGVKAAPSEQVESNVISQVG